MSVANPLTASGDIARSLGSKSASITKGRPLKPDLGVFASNVVKISKLGIEKQQKETQVESTRKIEEIAIEVIRSSSNIGKAHSVGEFIKQPSH
jgi:hypothetical protein